MREKQRLLSIVCHDIANFLFAIVAGADLISKDKSDIESLTRNIDTIKLAALRIDEIIKSVRMLQAVEHGRVKFELQPVNLDPIINDLKSIFAGRLTERKIKLVTELNYSSNIPVLADPKILLNNVLNNLISNAIKFSYPESTINVAIENRGQESAIIVNDQGIGIPQSMIGQIFDPGAKVSRPGTMGEQGTGFGMLTVKSFVDLFGGRIMINSKSETEYPHDHGTTTTIVLRNAS